MEEIWKNVSDYEGLYEVSNFGNIRSFRTRNRIKPIITKDGYHRLSLSKNNKVKNVFVHRIAAKAFIENIDNKPYINHIDGNKQNNNICNLEWVTSHENTLHSYKLGLQCKKGENNNFSKLNEEQVLIIKQRGYPAKYYANLFKVKVGSIYSIWQGRNWKYL